MNVRSGIVILLFFPLLKAAELKQETVKAWEAYIQAAHSRLVERLRAGRPFFWIDEAPDRSRQLRAGEILVSAMGEHNPKKVPSGLIHDWIGAAFIPNAKLDEVFAVVRNYDRYKEFYRPTVIDSKPIHQAYKEDKFSILVMNKALFLKTALDSEYESSYFQIDDKRWYSVGHTTRVQEIEHYGQPGEVKLPAGEGSGYIWRVYNISKFEERDSGVYVEVEVIALSRDIPASLRWLVNPIVRRVSKASLATSLGQTQDAVRLTGELALSSTTQASRMTLTKVN